MSIKEKSSYCLSCKSKNCMKGCPLSNDITDAIKYVKEEEYEKALRISEVLFSGNIKELSLEEIEDGFKDVPNFTAKESTLLELLVDNGIATSRREAREFLTAGSISINGEKATDENMVINKEVAIESKVIIVRKGKKKYYMGIFE